MHTDNVNGGTATVPASTTGDAASPHLHDHLVADHHSFKPLSRPKRDMSHIQGWGADLDRKNRPAVPMEHSPPRLDGAPLAAPVQQPERIEVLVSPERPHITPLFGTSTPPKGLSGMLRRLAFKTTENDIRHFLLLLLADRINVVEGIGEDLLSGHVPNVLAEMGIKAEWEHNKAGLVRKVAIAGAVGGLAYYLLKRRGAAPRP
ncbi:MAG: hypothetical protein JWP59_2894 [Massilia sp.]|jgi:hypothetical protein|nr:hypothetical protein [Massilia sp.]